MIQLINPSNTNVGNIDLSTAPATANILIEGTEQLSAGDTATIPSGAYKVEVFNTGLIAITVNGQSIAPNDSKPFEGRENPVLQRFDFTPEITVIVPNQSGASAYYSFNRPSA